MYKVEINPIAILYEIISSNQMLSSKEQIDKVYLQFRLELICIFRLVNSKLLFNSQTLFLSICYLDQIFSKPIIIKSKRDYILYGMSCYLIASKYSENDPNIPELNKYLKTLAEVTQYTYTFTLEELRNGELMALKYLDYKLNFFSIYHFVTYFFAHGILIEADHHSKEKHKFKSEINNNISFNFNCNNNQSKFYTKLLEKIYIQSRELLDFIIEDPKYCIIGTDNVLGAIEILRKSIELHAPNENKRDVFDLIYHIDQFISTQRIEGIRKIVNKVYINKTLKQIDDISRSTIDGNENIKQIPEKDSHNLITETIQSSNKKIIFSLNKIKGSNKIQNQQNKGNKLLVTNLFDLKQCSIKKRALSSHKEKEDKNDKKNNCLYVIKSKVIHNKNKVPLPHNKGPQLQQPNIQADPLFDQKNKKPPVNSIRIKKDMISNDQDITPSNGYTNIHCVNILLNSTKNTSKNIHFEYIPNSRKEDGHNHYHQQQDILEMTKKIFEQSKRNKMELRDSHYSSHDLNKNKIQSQTINDSLNQHQQYNTIIINNNININTFIKNKNTFDAKSNNILLNNNNEKDSLDASKNKFHQYQMHSSAIKSKGIGGNNKQNYFGTYFNYDNDSIINKTKFNNQKNDLFNSSEIKRIYNAYLV